MIILLYFWNRMTYSWCVFFSNAFTIRFACVPLPPWPIVHHEPLRSWAVFARPAKRSHTDHYGGHGTPACNRPRCCARRMPSRPTFPMQYLYVYNIWTIFNYKPNSQTRQIVCGTHIKRSMWDRQCNRCCSSARSPLSFCPQLFAIFVIEMKLIINF